MATTVEAKLRTQALANAGLAALIGTRWYDGRLQQGATFPAIVSILVSGNKTYSVNARLTTGFSRYQFTIWDTDSERARSVEDALASFLDGFNASGIAGLQRQPNEIIANRQSMIPAPEPPKFLRIVDARIFSNDTV